MASGCEMLQGTGNEDVCYQVHPIYSGRLIDNGCQHLSTSTGAQAYFWFMKTLPHPAQHLKNRAATDLDLKCRKTKA